MLVLNQVYFARGLLSFTDNKPIAVPLADARLSNSERFILKEKFFVQGIQENRRLHSLVSYILVASLKRKVTQSMIFSAFAKGWFRNALCGVIDFDNRITILFNQCLA
ncbi:hypothetical protein [Colwellia psychrerythraea]|uniref:hypothetical protein n=1 Tax=Colwellia psychrerythraea TaxID=28229 RepID=UPI00051A5CD3|nr:hypothetical protein [Colwellia psychrerythraea]